IPFKR
ncbi:acrB/AcrD/AcrF family protein, partial [Vibrio parahaemolyticus EKP-026]